MLELRPNCQRCDKDLPPQALDARICSYECTFCADCVDNHLHNVCPNCGGGFVPRPIRPSHPWRPRTSLDFDPAVTKRLSLKWTAAEVTDIVGKVKDIPPHER